jgi:hypothetical protein
MIRMKANTHFEAKSQPSIYSSGLHKTENSSWHPGCLSPFETN